MLEGMHEKPPPNMYTERKKGIDSTSQAKVELVGSMI